AYDDVDALERIDAPMGVVTHSPPELAEKALEKTGVEDEFDSVVSCTYETGFKPDPTPIETCMEDIGAEPDSTIMVGDSVSDVKGARNAGIVAGHIDRVGHEVEADYRFESLDDVAEIHADSTDETPEFSPTRSKQAR
ncbi:MAG: HAD-IA family hydrolase, partial [Halobacteria archaeon]|nr:HAD-IA family hydrolase [Halobacteria archaeon]